MSVCATAMVAANNAVATPTMAIKVGAQSYETANTGFTRVIRNTPAVTMVAAWMRADTGVGPSMASGNQMYSGNCALFPQAPMKSIKPMAVAVTADRAPDSAAWLMPE